MEYGTLIRQAWTITWRYRFLWILGVLAGGAVGVPGFNGSNGNSWRASQPEVTQISPAIATAGQEVAAWAALNAGVLIALAVVAFAVAVVLFVLSFIAQGSMAQATADLATGQTSSLGRAWRAGVRLFWRYVGLWLVLITAAIAIAALIGVVVGAAATALIVDQAPGMAIALIGLVGAAIIVGFVAFILNITRASDVPRWVVALGATVFALPMVTVLLAVGLTVSIVVAFAQRAIAVEDVGPIAALQFGWRVTRAHLGESLLTWLVNVALALVTGIAIVVGLFGAILLLGGMGAALYAVAGFSAPTVAYIGVGGLVFLVGVVLLAGIANTFFWTFWTLAYLRLSGRAAAAAPA